MVKQLCPAARADGSHDFSFGRSFGEAQPHDVYHAGLLSHSACGQQLYILLKSYADIILPSDRVARFFIRTKLWRGTRHLRTASVTQLVT